MAVPCPPDMQGRNMPMPNRLFPGRLLGNLFQRQRNFNQTFEHGLIALSVKSVMVDMVISDNNGICKLLQYNEMCHFDSLLSFQVRKQIEGWRHSWLGIPPHFRTCLWVCYDE